ncbi:hypothetical protein FOZ63_014271, partial [Perkinsus olseni]
DGMVEFIPVRLTSFDRISRDLVSIKYACLKAEHSLQAPGLARFMEWRIKYDKAGHLREGSMPLWPKSSAGSVSRGLRRPQLYVNGEITAVEAVGGSKAFMTARSVVVDIPGQIGLCHRGNAFRYPSDCSDEASVVLRVGMSPLRSAACSWRLCPPTDGSNPEYIIMQGEAKGGAPVTEHDNGN